MNAAYHEIIAASDDDQRDLFATAASRVGTTVQNIEKDFWVCWTLDALFHRLKAGGPRLLFKGGTSLSKGYGLISRFSEDIDVTVFRSDIGQEAEYKELEALSGKQRKKRLDAIKAACQEYIDRKLREELNALAEETMGSVGKDPAALRIVLDESDENKQSLLVHYPSVVEKSAYISPSAKIESGAKSALDPNEEKEISPYITADVPDGGALTVSKVTTIDPQRTFLDKILIIHGINFYFDAKNVLRGDGRMSRHYYDVHRLMGAALGEKACADDARIEDCVRHARMFFYRKDTGLEVAKRGAFDLRPRKQMLDTLRRDYGAMATMIIGDVPSFDEVMNSIGRAEDQLNAAP